jgi:mRNA-degrading endonuclease RelE of RelBE toxin-antitoxin system
MLGEDEGFSFSPRDTRYAIRIKKRKIGRDCGKIKGKIFNYRIQVCLIGKFIDN